jgi:hypothetical protein
LNAKFFPLQKNANLQGQNHIEKKIMAFLLHVTMGLNVVLKHVLQGSQILLLS